MATPTLLVLRGIIDDILNDDEVTDAEIDSGINEAILSVRGDMLVTQAVDIAVAAQPHAIPAGMVFIYSLTVDHVEIPPFAWAIREHTSPEITWNLPYFGGGAPSGTIHMSGGGFQEVLSVDGDTLNIDPGYITARALANIHASRGGTASDLSDWHKSEHSKWAAIAEARLPLGLLNYGPPPGARVVKGRLTA